MFGMNLDGLARIRPVQSRSINWENRTGEKGGACKAASALGPSRKGSPCIGRIESQETVALMDVEGAGVIRHIWCTVTNETPAGKFVLRDIVLRMYWDDQENPSVEVPLGDFFLNGFAEGYQVNSMLMTVNPKRGMNCYIPMPFRKRAKITIENQHKGPIDAFFFQIDYELWDEKDMPEDFAYFHAQWRRQPITVKGKDYVALDGVRGSGQFLGMHMMIQSLERYWYGEGEVKFYIDSDEQYPTQCSTGLEDYFGGAWSFGGQLDERGYMLEKTYCTPFAGYPFYSRDDTFHSDYYNRDIPPMRSFYRWHVPDPVTFREDLRVEVQQIGCYPYGLFERQDDVTTVCYWYQTQPYTAFPALPSALERHPR